jgi:large subunit ribosomal protein L6
MSRLGKLPIKLSAGVQATVQEGEMTFKGPKGEFRLKLDANVEVTVTPSEVTVALRNKEEKNAAAVWGLMWSLIKNAVEGVGIGFTRKLEINGVGYRAAVSGNNLNMSLGFSHPIEFKLPAGVSAAVADNVITLSGIDKALVGEMAAQIRKIRRPEPYKGKGVKYAEEIIRRKAGKATVKGAK